MEKVRSAIICYWSLTTSIKKKNPVGINPKLNLNTLGARAVVTVGEWKMRGEFAHQFGEYENHRDRIGNGGYVFLGQKI